MEWSLSRFFFFSREAIFYCHKIMNGSLIRSSRELLGQKEKWLRKTSRRGKQPLVKPAVFVNEARPDLHPLNSLLFSLTFISE